MTIELAAAAAAPATVAAPASHILTLDRATSAFEAWENDFRANPETFYTAEDTAAMEVATVSEARGIHFMALLRDQPPALLPPAPGEYWPAQGGRYVCTLGAMMGMPARHLIVGDGEGEDLSFGPYERVEGVDSHADGRSNTLALLATGKPHPAAKWAADFTADGHADFFLPSRVDLVMAHACAPQLFKKSGRYWSSTQSSRSSAFAQDFEYGYSGWNFKGNEFRVRAFRVIPT
jgi:hypothetical protein